LTHCLLLLREHSQHFCFYSFSESGKTDRQDAQYAGRPRKNYCDAVNGDALCVVQ